MCQTHHVDASCRSTKVNCLKDWNDEKHKVETETDILENDPVAFAEFTSKDGWEEWQFDKFSFVAISEEFELKNSASLSEDDLNRHIVKLRTKKEDVFAIDNSGIPI